MALAPQYAKGWQVLASLLRQLEKLSEAVDCRRKAVALEPDSVPLLVRLASALVDTRQVAEGLSLYRQALARDPGNIAAHSSLALSMASSVWSLPLNARNSSISLSRAVAAATQP